MSDRKARQSLYKTRRWHRLRAIQLRDEPTCRLHRQLGQTVTATVADHVIPHKGEEGIFFDQDNLQSLCKQCHDSHKKRQEMTGVLIGGDVQGFPVDPDHHWNSPYKLKKIPKSGKV